MIVLFTLAYAIISIIVGGINGYIYNQMQPEEKRHPSFITILTSILASFYAIGGMLLGFYLWESFEAFIGLIIGTIVGLSIRQALIYLYEGI